MHQKTKRPKVLILIVGRHVDHGLKTVLDQVPISLWDSLQYETEILAIDDATRAAGPRAIQLSRNFYKTARLNILCNRDEQGYGGNQKIGLHYAVRRHFDVVVLLQAERHYRLETLPAFIEPILKGKTDVILGSRPLNKADAKHGGMSLYKRVGNRFVSRIQNWFLGTRYTEFHSGYRVYSVKAVDRVPFQCNSNAYEFDTEIVIQLLDQLCRVHEFPVLAEQRGRDFRSHGVRYGLNVLLSTVLSRLQRLQLFYSPKFDYRMRPVLFTAPGLERLLSEQAHESGGTGERRQEFGVHS